MIKCTHGVLIRRCVICSEMGTIDSDIKTPQTHPEHHTVGHLFVATEPATGDSQILYCDSYDPRCGYWMTVVNGIGRRNVSERAIDRTIHTIYFDSYDGITRTWSRWGNPFTKSQNSA